VILDWEALKSPTTAGCEKATPWPTPEYDVLSTTERGSPKGPNRGVDPATKKHMSGYFNIDMLTLNHRNVVSSSAQASVPLEGLRRGQDIP